MKIKTMFATGALLLSIVAIGSAKSWDIVVDNCAICRNHIMDLCKYSPLPR